MKISIDIDCTPEEARKFLGLPDVAPLQTAFVEELEKRTMAGLKAMDSDALMKLWLPGSLENWERIQKAMWQQMTGTGAGKGGGKGGDK